MEIFIKLTALGALVLAILAFDRTRRIRNLQRRLAETKLKCEMTSARVRKFTENTLMRIEDVIRDQEKPTSQLKVKKPNSYDEWFLD